MIMKYTAIIIFIFLFSFGVVRAQVVINEVQISPINERFIELYNISSSDIDLTGWYIQRKTATGSSFSSMVTSSDFENKTIKANGYFLISRSSVANADIILDTLTITEFNVIRLRNSTREDIDYVELGDINAGESYQRTLSGGWVTAPPTPNSSNLISSDSNVQNKAENSQYQITDNSDDFDSQSSVSNFPIEPQIFANIKVDKNVIVGADTLFEGRSLGLEKKPLANARYVWNFGNGEKKEGQNVLHHYQYPGEYVVVLNVSSGEYSATDRIVVNAYPTEIEISRIEDDFIELHNKSDKELNLSWWQLQSAWKRFVIPKDTIILPNKKLVFSSDITKLDTAIKDNILLLYPNGMEATKFEQIKIPQVVSVETNIPTVPSQMAQLPVVKKTGSTGVIQEPADSERKGVADNTAQTTSVISSLNNNGNENNIYKWIMAIFGVVAVSVGIIIYASNKKELGEDIEIIE